MRVRFLVLSMLVAAGVAEPVVAQPDPSRPAFQLSSPQVYTTKDRPLVWLTFQRVTSLDLRVYKVRDPLAFFIGLKEAHVLGSPDPVVPQEQTWIERLARWKARQRAWWRHLLRRQVSTAYRASRREAADTRRAAQRRTVSHTRFAQVPLLNAAQVVATWRELLPDTRDPEVRRLPLDLPGPGAFVVEAVTGHLKAYTVVIVSDIGLVTKAAPGQLLAYAAQRFSGEPLEGCDVGVIASQSLVARGRTSRDGVVALDVAGITADEVIAIARCGDDVTATDPGTWSMRAPVRELVGYIYSDRPVYRPGHQVNVKALLRWRDRGELRPFDAREIEIAIKDPDDKVVARHMRPVDEFGAATMAWTAPADAALGYYSVQVKHGDREADGSFEVQEYRKPEFEVAVTAQERFVRQGRGAVAVLRARYYFGQPVAGAFVKYVVYRNGYSSPHRWIDEFDAPPDAFHYDHGYYGEQISEETTRLDARGEATIRIPVHVSDGDVALRIEARVSDVSGREVSGHTTVYGTVGAFVLATSVDQYVKRPGEAATVRVRAVDYVGQVQAGIATTVTLERLTWPEERYDEPRVEVIGSTVLTTDAEGRAVWRTNMPAQPGRYRFVATARSDGRVVSGSSQAWVPGAGEDYYGSEDRTLELVPDRRSYQPGETARLLVRGEDVSGAVLVTKERELTSYYRVVRLGTGDAIEVPVGEDDLGDVYVNIAWVKDDRLYVAERRLVVPAVSRQVQVTVQPAEPVARPRDPGVFVVRTTGADGRPVRAQVSLGVVDEALYGVRPDATPDPLRFFYRRDYSRVSTQFSRDYGFVGYSGTQQLLLAQRRRPLGLADFKADRPERPEVRRDFPDAIFWTASLVTGPDGEATVKLAYPDALTTWRATARAVTVDTRVGAGVARTTVTKDLIVRAITPRFLTEGDTVNLPVIVHNYLPGGRAIEVTLDAKGVSPVATAPAVVSFTVPPGGEDRATWSYRADAAGRATFTAAATTGTDRDAVERSLPVLPYGLKRERGASGSLDAAGPAIAWLEVPAASNPAARTIDVTLAPTLAGSLLGALDDLADFPYGCTEQTVSSFLPNLLAARAMATLGLPPTARLREADRMATAGLRRLLDLQHEDGGFGWWKTDENDPFMTAYALYGLLEAERAGLRVPGSKVRDAVRATVQLYAAYPRAVPELKAYLAWVLARAEAAGHLGGPDSTGWNAAGVRDELWAARERLSSYGRALLVLLLDAQKDPRGNDAASGLMTAVKTLGELSWWPSADDPLLGDVYDASAESTALAVHALARRAPDDPILTRAVRWLLANRRGGGWGSTKQSALALYALLEYLQARKEAPATFTVDVVVNGEPAGSHTFTPASWTRADPVRLRVPAREGPSEVRLVKKGPGTLYWTATARYYDTAGSVEASGTRKLALSREYFSLAPVIVKDRIVYRATPFGGAARPGDLILVRLVAAGAREWKHLVVEDPMPAGCEAVTQSEAYDLESPPAWWWGSQREYRDDRVVTFLERFGQGRYELSYLLRVVTPGEFRAMPAQITPMYAPGISATTGIETMRVSPPGAFPAATGGGGTR